MNDISILRNSLAAKGFCTARLLSAYMRVEYLIYREPSSIFGAAINDFRATKSPVRADPRPLTTKIPLDFVVDAGACIAHEIRLPLGGPHFEPDWFAISLSFSFSLSFTLALSPSPSLYISLFFF